MIKSFSRQIFWSAPIGLLVGLAIAALFRGHLNVEYTFLVATLVAATFALVTFAILYTAKQGKQDRSQFLDRLHQRHEAKRQRRATYQPRPQA